MSKRDKVMRGSRNERTSKRVAAIAGKVLRKLENVSGNQLYVLHNAEFVMVCKKDEAQALAASTLTQSPDRIVHATARPKKAGRVGRK